VQLSRLFTTTTYKALAEGRGAKVVKSILSAGECLSQYRGMSIRAVYEEAYEGLFAGYRNEYVFKNEITKRILLGKHSLRTARLLSEFCVKDVKVDVAVINGTSSAYEIKTDLDDFDRLSRQLARYSLVFDRVYVVTSELISDAVAKRIPVHVGQVILTRKGSLSTRKKALSNRGNTDPDAIFQSLRLSEIEDIGEAFGVQRYVGPNLHRRRHYLNSFRQMGPEQAHQGMVDVLRKREIHGAQLELIRGAPGSMKHLCLSRQLTVTGYRAVAEALDARL